MSVSTKQGSRSGLLKSEMDESVFDKIIGSIGTGRLAWLKELVENSDDFRASTIQITVTPDAIRIEDDGVGFSPEGRNAYVSLGKSVGKRNRKGKFGTGSKVVFNVAQSLTVLTVWEEEQDTAVRFSFTKEQLKKLLWKNPDAQPVRYTAEPRTPQNFSSRWQTGSIITFEDFLKKPPKAEEIRRDLAKYLPPWVAEKVRVNGKPLEVREIKGERIERDTNHDLLGLVRVRLYVPVEQQESEELMIGSYGPVCSFRNFRKQIEQPELSLVPVVFSDPTICGLIDVEAFNTFATQGRQQFSTGLFESELLVHFLTLLDLELAEDLQRLVGMVRRSSEEEENDRILDGLQELVTNAYPHIPSTVPGKEGRKTESEGFITPRFVELSPGDTQVFRIRRFSGDSAQVRWNVKHSGGTLDTVVGTEVIYTAGLTEGRFLLTAQSDEEPLFHAETTIAIVARREFHTTPSRVILEPGQTQRIYARNFTGTPDQLRWRPDHCGGHLSTDRGFSVLYTAGSKLGEFSLRVESRQDPKIFFEIPISIVEEKPSRKGGKPGEGNRTVPNRREIKIGDCIYLMGKIDQSKNPRTLTVAEGRTHTNVFFNTGHPMYLRARSMSRQSGENFLMAELVTKHALLQNPDNFFKFEELRGSILAEIIRSRSR